MNFCWRKFKRIFDMAAEANGKFEHYNQIPEFKIDCDKAVDWAILYYGENAPRCSCFFKMIKEQDSNPHNCNRALCRCGCMDLTQLECKGEMW